MDKSKLLKLLMQIRDALRKGQISHATRRLMTLIKRVSDPDVVLGDQPETTKAEDE